MTELLSVVSTLLVVSGGLFVLVGGIGLLRFPDLFTRMHAASVTDAMGPLLILGGLMLEAGWSLATAKLLIILVFFLFTTPTATYALANAATLAGAAKKSSGTSDKKDA
ncbi:monovalent cation/H(+) antiporter subunit G [Pseudokordiimonas caeni]|uniref:monovalent cation/H(+) antiporter subunit G n=1 Tax=Pseudokordiimonas caeni TaxID=2997908 RepID=UPI002810B84F|nr:monovalent cation/H(+) antiporter subunit G [Pseudokordiimonas caeni]